MIASLNYNDWVQIAKVRWLTPDEINVILNNYENIGFPSNFHKPCSPQDGAIYIYDRSVVPDFKLDGIEWTKKRGSNKIYELFIKLNCGGVHTITGLYYTGRDTLFRRRCYRLAGASVESGVSQVYLVHYRDCRTDANLKRGCGHTHSPLQVYQHQHQHAKEGTLSVDRSVLKEEQVSSGSNNGNDTHAGTMNNIHAREEDCTDSVDFSAFGSMEDADLVHEMLVALGGDEISGMYSHALDENEVAGGVLPQPPLLSPTVSVAAPLSVKMEGLAKRNVRELELVQGVDMVPVVGDVRGGTKVLLCLSRPLQFTAVRVFFTPVQSMLQGVGGDSKREQSSICEEAGSGATQGWCSVGEVLSAGCVVRCHSPPPPDGRACQCRVSVYSLGGEELVSLASTPFFFEYAADAATCAPQSDNTPQSNSQGTSVLSSSGSKKRSTMSEEPPELMSSDDTLSLAAPPHPSAKGGGLSDNSSGILQDQCRDGGAHKIRIVEQLLRGGTSRCDVIEASVHKAISQPMTLGDQVSDRVKAEEKDVECGGHEQVTEPDHEKRREKEGEDEEWLDDTQLLGLSSADLEGLMDQFLLRVVQQLVNLASVDEDLLAGAELDGLDSSGYSLLHYCCMFNLISLVSRLIDRGADLNLKTRCQSTALHLAAASGHIGAVTQLVDAGALLDLEDSTGAVAADLAGQRGYPRIKALLDEAAEHQEQSYQCRERPDGINGLGDMHIAGSRRTQQSSHEQQRNRGLSEDSSSTLSHSSSPTSLLATSPPGNNFGCCHNLSDRDRHASDRTSSDSALSVSNSSLLHGALSSLSLTDKCALSLTLGEGGHTPDDIEVQSVLSETDVESLDVAMSMMGPLELGAVEDEVKVIQSNVRTWLLRKNYTNLRDAAKTLQVAWRGRERRSRPRSGHSSSSSTLDSPPAPPLASSSSTSSAHRIYQSHSHSHAGQKPEASVSSSFVTTSTAASSTFSGCNSDANVDVAVGIDGMGGMDGLAPESKGIKSIDARAATLRLQAATRGMLSRRSFQRAKKQAMASLVIFQWWVESNKRNVNSSGRCIHSHNSNGEDEDEDGACMSSAMDVE